MNRAQRWVGLRQETAAPRAAALVTRSSLRGAFLVLRVNAVLVHCDLLCFDRVRYSPLRPRDGRGGELVGPLNELIPGHALGCT